MALQANGLVNVPGFKDWFGLPPEHADADDAIELLIDAASDEIESFCRRVFRREALVDEASDGAGAPYLYVSRPPILLAAGVTVKIQNGSAITVDAADLAVYDTLGKVVLKSSVLEYGRRRALSVFPAGERNILVTYTGGYLPIPAPVQLACHLAIAANWHLRKSDPSVETESAGSSSRTRRPAMGLTLPKAAVDRLVPYMIPLTSVVGG